MKWTHIRRDWHRYGSAAQAAWSRLTSTELRRIAGDPKMLTDRLHVRYGVSRREAERQIADWSNRLTRDYR